MGLMHVAAGPPPDDQVAGDLPVLGDRGVSDTVALSLAYAEVRQALLALSGISLMHHLGLGSPASLAGVVVTARTAVDSARGHLGRPAASRHPAVRLRAGLLDEACDALAHELGVLSRDGRAEVPRQLLELVRAVLVRASLVEAGMRRFTSVSCAQYGGEHTHPYGHGHTHDHPHVHGHVHG